MAKIDPAFRAAPNINIDWAQLRAESRQEEMLKYQREQVRSQKQQKDYEEGLKKLDVDLKAWEDTQGTEELTTELARLRDLYTSYGMRGINLTIPTNRSEQILGKTFNSKLQELKNNVDIWQRNKSRIDKARELLSDKLATDETNGYVNVPETASNIDNYFKTPGSVAERSKLLDDLVVIKPKPVDIGNYFAKQYENLLTSTLDQKSPDVRINEETGRIKIITTKEMDTARIDEATKKIASNIQYAPQNIRSAVDQAYMIDKGETLLSKEEWIKEHFLAPSPKQTSISIRGGTTKGGLTFNFLGQKVEGVQAGTLQDTPRPYGTGDKGRTYQSVYDFPELKQTFKVPLGAKGSSYFMGQGWLPLEGGGDVEANLLFYDSNRDEFVFRTTQAGIAPFTMNNMTIAVPRKNLGNQVDELPIIVDGVARRIKDVFGSNEMEVKTIGGIDFRTEEMKKAEEEKKKNEKKTIGGKNYKETGIYLPSKKKVISENIEMRVDGTMKGNGFLGVLKRTDGGVSTELSIGVDIDGKEIEIPTLISTLTEEEKKYLLSTEPDKIFTDNPDLFSSIEKKAIIHAKKRISEGKSPFADNGESPKNK
jgi:hypothetical protein